VCADAGLVVPIEAGPTAALHNSAASGDAATPDVNLESKIEEIMSELKEVKGAIKAIRSDNDKAMSQYGYSKGDLSDLVNEKAFLLESFNLLQKQKNLLIEQKQSSSGMR
jgi:hypothetical protein